MRRRTIIASASVAALAGGSLLYLRRDGGEDLPPRMSPAGEATSTGVLVRRRTVDYESVVRSALTERAALIVATLKADVIRDQLLEDSVRYVPLPKSRARVRVKYRVEYTIGIPLGPGDFSISREGGALVVAVRRPRLVASPSVKLLSYDVLESGLLIDERTAVIELQRRIQPEAERRGRRLVARPAVLARGERVLRGLLRGLLERAGGPYAQPPPTVAIRYR